MNTHILPSLLLLVSVTISGCAWTNKEWLKEEEQNPSPTKDVSLLNPIKRPPEPADNRPWIPIAILESKSTKIWGDSHLDLLRSTIPAARAIGADAIWCPGLKKIAGAPEEVQAIVAATYPSLEDIEKAAKFSEQLLNLIKNLVAIPVTIWTNFKTEVLSDKTMFCVAYRRYTSTQRQGNDPSK